MMDFQEVTLPFSSKLETGKDIELSSRFSEFTLNINMVTTDPTSASSSSTDAAVPSSSSAVGLCALCIVTKKTGTEQIVALVETRAPTATATQLDITLPICRANAKLQREEQEFALRLKPMFESSSGGKKSDDKKTDNKKKKTASSSSSCSVMVHGIQRTLFTDAQVKALKQQQQQQQNKA